MKRRVIKQGNNTLTITLPKNWTSRFGVRPGDELDLEEKQNNIVVSTAPKSSVRETVVEIPAGTQLRRRLIARPYIEGYDRIRVNYHDTVGFKTVEETLKLMIGFEMIEQHEHNCVLENVAGGIEDEFENVYNRLFNLCIDMANSVHDAIAKKQFERLENIGAMESLANRINLFCKRMLNKLPKEQSSVTALYRINCCLETVTDYFKDIADAVSQRKTPVEKEIIQLIGELKEPLELMRKAYTKRDAAAMQALGRDISDLEIHWRAVAPKTKGASVALLVAVAGIESEYHSISEELT